MLAFRMLRRKKSHCVVCLCAMLNGKRCWTGCIVPDPLSNVYFIQLSNAQYAQTVRLWLCVPLLALQLKSTWMQIRKCSEISHPRCILFRFLLRLQRPKFMANCCMNTRNYRCFYGDFYLNNIHTTNDLISKRQMSRKINRTYRKSCKTNYFLKASEQTSDCLAKLDIFKMVHRNRNLYVFLAIDVNE